MNKAAGNISTYIFYIILFLSSSNASFALDMTDSNALFERKAEIALELTAPIVRCIDRNDTTHPVFHGCYDWHSSVHATWALIAYMKISGDGRYRDTVKSILDEGKLSEERRHLKEKPLFEMPYGRAWFLQLVMEYTLFFNDNRLLDFGDEIAASLLDYYKNKPPDPLTKSYQNASWALLNLLEYGHFRKRPDLVAFVRENVQKYYINNAASCTEANSRPNFMAVCTNWAWLVGSIMPREYYIKWLNDFLPLDRPLLPITEFNKTHEYGLNFSRSWGLYRIYLLTAKNDYRESFTKHFLATYNNRSHWDGEYKKVGHWVAQFGMFALKQLPP